MVKLTGPALSLGARGSIAGTLSFAAVHGKPYVKRKPTVPNMKTPAQVSIRQMVRFLTTEWNGLTEGEKDSYADDALDLAIARYHAYLKLNMQRWRVFRAPTKTWPPAGGGLYPGMTGATATGHYHHAVLQWDIGNLNDGWGTCIFRSQDGGFTPTRNDAVQVLHLYDSTTITWMDEPLAPGTYYYRHQTFTDEGRWNVPTPERSAVVT